MIRLRARSAPSAAFAIDPFWEGLSHVASVDTGMVITLCTSSTAGAKTISLPAAAGNSGFIWVLKLTRSDGTAYTITPVSGTIEGAASYMVNDVTAPAVWFVADGISNWALVS